jgi:mono/diheme cytochrome c family protein
MRLLLLLVAAVAARPQAAPNSATAGDDFFETSVRPLLADHCFKCHGEERAKSELRLDSRELLLKGGKRGPAAVPGKPDESRLVQAVRRDGELKMPPKADEALDAKEVAALARWVELGLPWPADADAKTKARSDAGAAAIDRPFSAEERAFWSFQPLADPAPPTLAGDTWSSGDLDRFVLAKLRTQGLEPAPPADRRTWIRRVTFDLTGLPPTPDEVAAFLADESAERDACAKVVDRLLASPRYGERWARHWLDVVRYADSFDARSIGTDGDMTEAWRYRDWVVDAFTRDLPFAEFVQDQIAGDLRAEHDGAFDAARLVATGVLAIGNWGGGDADKEKLLTDIADDQVDLVGRAFLGLTLGCARCHDHKFDPITSADYYGLAGVFFSSHILPDVGPKTAGPPMLHLPLASAAELAQRASRDARIVELTNQVAAAIGGVPLTTVVHDVAGKSGVVALRNSADTPSLTVNSNDRTVSFSTVTLPPRCVAVHPSPNAGVAAIWTSPVAATLAVSGRVADADAVCGDGVEWTLERCAAADRACVVVARGAIDNGGAMALADAADGAKLAALAVEKGDELRLTILPRKEYTCDTTVVEWRIGAWSLTDDLLADVARGDANAPHDPLPASDGASWRFVDRALPTLDAAALERLAADAANAAIAPAIRELVTLCAAPPPPLQYAVGIQEGGVPHTAHEGVHDVAIHHRGRYDRLGPVVPRRVPRILAGDDVDAAHITTSGSGRRELAAWLVRPENPLTARVFVNRVWQHHFGFGLVRTPGDFGKRGEPPTHPELLDWLTRRFLASGGSLKQLHRTIVLSSVYRQSSIPSAAALAADPDNRWLARMNRTRLDAEELRDALLFVSGELDETRGGPAVRDPAARRRTLYSATVRSDRATARALFDAADPTAIVDQRVETTVAPQALWLMNDDFVLDRAAALARRVASELPDGSTHADAIRRMFELVDQRPPDDAETAIVNALREQPGGSWEEVAHVLLLGNEFMFVD